EVGYSDPTPIQALVLPVALSGRDLIGQARTGSGKTAAFAVPILEQLDPNSESVQALVLCPTRELAAQVTIEFEKLAKGRSGQILTVVGGDPIRRQLDGLIAHPQVVVGTPGRVLDHLQRRTLSLGAIRFVVLDEADRMLDMGFAPDVERILLQTSKERQTMLFSATVPEWVHRLAARHLHPALLGRGYDVTVIHGDLSQRERDQALERFRGSRVRFLIATDVAARGL